MQLGHHDFGCRTLQLVIVLDVGGDAATVVENGQRIVRVDDDLDVIAPAGQRFVDRVVQHLEDHVVQTRAI